MPLETCKSLRNERWCEVAESVRIVCDVAKQRQELIAGRQRSTNLSYTKSSGERHGRAALQGEVLHQVVQNLGSPVGDGIDEVAGTPNMIIMPVRRGSAEQEL